MLDTPANREFVLKKFPKLELDPYWSITSDPNPNYNCIAWAGIKNNIFWWPAAELKYKKLPGVEWPFNLPLSEDLDTFIKLFNHLEYEICEDSEFESGFQKIALYWKEAVVGSGEFLCTHAARQLSKKIWTSKLGPAWDIEHSRPEFIEGIDYGTVIKCMKRPNSSFIFT